MSRIAHLTDLHLLEAHPRARAGSARLRLEYLCLITKVNALARRYGALTALRSARAQADHLVITGDLTEDGEAAQFELAGELLHAAGWREDEVTLVPGNHDRYGLPDAWERAFEGPLAPWRRSSTLGRPVELDDVVLVPIDSSVPQAWVRSSGEVDMERVPDAARIPAGDRAVALLVHHPPFKIRTHRIHGLLNYMALHEHLVAHPRWVCLHGHTHLRTDRPVGHEAPRVRGNEAVVVDPGALRLYDVVDGTLRPVEDEEALAAK